MADKITTNTDDKEAVDKYQATADTMMERVFTRLKERSILDEMSAYVDPKILLKLVKKSKADDTWRAYRHDLIDFLRSTEATEFPFHPGLIIAYIHKQKNNIAPTTLARRVYAIGTISRLLGENDPTNGPYVREALKGARKERVNGDELPPWFANQAPALLYDDFLKMIEVIDIGAPQGLRDQALIEVGFWGAFRVGELVTLRASQCHFTTDHVSIRMGPSKTDQTSEKQHFKVLPSIDRSQNGTNPYSALITWVEAFNIKGEDFIFRRIFRGGKLGDATKHLSEVSAGKVIKHYAGLAGLKNPERYTIHSLRAGFVTLARDVGQEDHRIIKQTGHSTERMLETYDRPETIGKHHPVNDLVKKLYSNIDSDTNEDLQ